MFFRVVGVTFVSVGGKCFIDVIALCKIVYIRLFVRSYERK